MLHKEPHRSDRTSWLRAAVLGANDGIVSTASLVIGVAAADASHQTVLITGIAGLVAGAMSMAAGEYVSVSSQSDLEQADLAQERRELATDPEGELAELAAIYRKRGLDASLAEQVAQQLTAENALEAHARDELGMFEHAMARPIQASLASAGAFAVGGALPLITALLLPAEWTGLGVSTLSLGFLAMLGSLSAYAGGAPLGKAIMRVTFWGALAMAATAAIGQLFDINV